MSSALLVVEYSSARSGVQLLQRVQGMAKCTEKPASLRQGDSDLVRRFLEGDSTAFSELFQLHQKNVTRLVARMLGSADGVQDIVQEVFLQVFRSLPRFRGTSQLSTWIYRVGVNVALMHRRSMRSRPKLEQDETVVAPADADPLPDEQLERRLRVAALARLMDRLSEKKRTVFVLHELEGLTPVEIAEIVRAPVLTVRTRLFYARRELMDLIAGEPSLRGLFDDEHDRATTPVVRKAKAGDS